MTPIIVSYLPGMPGQPLADFLFAEHDKDYFSEAYERKDRGQFNISYLKKSSYLADDETNQMYYDKIKAIIPMCTTHLVTDYREYSKLKELAPTHMVIKLHPKTNILGYIKRYITRTSIGENYNESEFSIVIDSIFGEISTIYDAIINDKEIDQVVDYSDLADEKYLIELFKQVNDGGEPDEYSLEYAQEMIIKTNADHFNDCTSLNIEKIIDTVGPKDFFDIALCIFLYERNYNTINKNRQWTIDDMPADIIQAVQFLIRNSKNYRIFN